MQSTPAAATMRHDYRRNSTTTLFAALNVLDGQVMGQCRQRHTHAEWPKFLRKIGRQTPKDKTLRLVADNGATHHKPKPITWTKCVRDILQMVLRANCRLISKQSATLP